MDRDMEIVRLILLRQVGDTQAKEALEQIKAQLGDAGMRFQAQHTALHIEAGFVEGRVMTDVNGAPHMAVLIRLTWEGHNFLDTIRNETVWKNTKETLLKPGASWTLPLLTQVAESEIRKNLGILD